MERLAQADDLLLKAVMQLEKDPQGSLSVARATCIAAIAQALLLRELIDRTGVLEIEIEDDDENGDKPAEDDKPPKGYRPW